MKFLRKKSFCGTFCQSYSLTELGGGGGEDGGGRRGRAPSRPNFLHFMQFLIKNCHIIGWHPNWGWLPHLGNPVSATENLSVAIFIFKSLSESVISNFERTGMTSFDVKLSWRLLV